MNLDGGRLVLSPSDLVGFLYCPRLTELSLATIAGVLPRPANNDPELEVVQRRGLEHESRHLTQLEDDGYGVVQIDTRSSFGEQVEQTLEGAPGLRSISFYQGAFLDLTGDGPAWRGHADFLRRVTTPSKLGAFSYEPEDTKLARQARPSAILKLCDYAGHLQRIQGIAPDFIPRDSGRRQVESLRLRDFAAYYRAVKVQFEKAIASRVSAYPNPVSHCAVCS